MRGRPGDEVAIYTIAADGTDERRVTTIPDVIWDPDKPPRAYIRTVEWSPDGSKILFVENRDLVGDDCYSPSTEGIYVVGADGSGPEGLGISDPRVYWYSAAAWSPDGSRIAVSTGDDTEFRHLYRNCDFVIYAAMDVHPRHLVVFTMAADGTDVELLAQTDEDGKLVGTWLSYDDVARNVAACSDGTLVAEPEANPGLVGDCETLIALRDALFVRPTANWWAAVPIENWIGVTVEGSPARVTGLTLGAVEMGGRIPSLLGELSELRVLDLSRNTLSGVIPSGLGRLKNLEILDLSDNELSGAIPAELGGLTNLEKLDLSGNRLTGVPMELEQLTGLRELNLSGNDLEGCISAGLRAIESNDLSELGLQDCEAVESDGQPSKPSSPAAVEQAESDPSPAGTRTSDSGPAEEVRQRPTESVSGWWALAVLPLAVAAFVVVRLVKRWRAGN